MLHLIKSIAVAPRLAIAGGTMPIDHLPTCALVNPAWPGASGPMLLLTSGRQNRPVHSNVYKSLHLLDDLPVNIGKLLT